MPGGPPLRQLGGGPPKPVPKTPPGSPPGPPVSLWPDDVDSDEALLNDPNIGPSPPWPSPPHLPPPLPPTSKLSFGQRLGLGGTPPSSPSPPRKAAAKKSGPPAPDNPAAGHDIFVGGGAAKVLDEWAARDLPKGYTLTTGGANMLRICVLRVVRPPPIKMPYGVFNSHEIMQMYRLCKWEGAAHSKPAWAKGQTKKDTEENVRALHAGLRERGFGKGHPMPASNAWASYAYYTSPAKSPPKPAAPAPDLRPLQTTTHALAHRALDTGAIPVTPAARNAAERVVKAFVNSDKLNYSNQEVANLSLSVKLVVLRKPHYAFPSTIIMGMGLPQDICALSVPDATVKAAVVWASEMDEAKRHKNVRTVRRELFEMGYGGGMIGGGTLAASPARFKSPPGKVGGPMQAAAEERVRQELLAMNKKPRLYTQTARVVPAQIFPFRRGRADVVKLEHEKVLVIPVKRGKPRPSPDKPVGGILGDRSGTAELGPAVHSYQGIQPLLSPAYQSKQKMYETRVARFLGEDYDNDIDYNKKMDTRYPRNQVETRQLIDAIHALTGIDATDHELNYRGDVQRRLNRQGLQYMVQLKLKQESDPRPTVADSTPPTKRKAVHFPALDPGTRLLAKNVKGGDIDVWYATPPAGKRAPIRVSKHAKAERAILRPAGKAGKAVLTTFASPHSPKKASKRTRIPRVNKVRMSSPGGAATLTSAAAAAAPPRVNPNAALLARHKPKAGKKKWQPDIKINLH